jgi:hypothetical protein
MRILVVVAMITGLSTAQAAEATLTLECQGRTSTGSDEKNPQPVSMGIIVNFTARTVLGFTFPGADLPVTITKFDDVHILFEGSSKSGDQRLYGGIDRVTGDVSAMDILTDGKPHDFFNEPLGAGVISSTNYFLKCSPTQRKF